MQLLEVLAAGPRLQPGPKWIIKFSCFSLADNPAKQTKIEVQLAAPGAEK